MTTAASDQTWTFAAEVTAVYKQSPILRIERGPNWDHDKNDRIIQYGPTAWYVRCGLWSFQVGADEPPIAVGDTLELTIRKAPSL